MFDLCLALVVYKVCTLIHILYCRLTPNKGLHAKVFIFISIAGLAIYAITAHLSRQWFDPSSIWALPMFLSSGVMYILLIPVYLIFYVLTQLTSPSKKILLNLKQTGGSTHEQIVASLKEENFITTRLDDLCISGCIACADGRYQLSPSGESIAVVLNTMRWMLGRKAGG